MSTQEKTLYSAIILITLPDVDERVQAQVTIAPTEMISADGKMKRLHECTLLDLAEFANEVGEEVWEAYKEIRLIDLAHNDDDNMTLMLVDENDAPVKPAREWFQQALVWIPEMESEDEAEETAVIHTPDLQPELSEADVAAKHELAEWADELSTVNDAAETAVSPPTNNDDIRIVILDSVPVTSNDTLNKTLPGMELVGDTYIQHSKARVRTAGERLPIGNPTWRAVDILVDEPALRGAQAHALSSLDREVAGVMIGPRPEKQPDGRYVVHVIDTILAKYTVMQGASVTYTPESWRYMNDKLMERYPDETAVIVGWYHTHPGFGIFLSGMDQFIHQNFFTQKWHIAFVLDPRARSSGFFCWDREQTRVSPYNFRWPSWANGSW